MKSEEWLLWVVVEASLSIEFVYFLAPWAMPGILLPRMIRNIGFKLSVRFVRLVLQLNRRLWTSTTFRSVVGS